MYKPRPNELTAVLGRDGFDLLPSGVKGAADELRWREFRAAYHRAANLDGGGEFPLQIDVALNSTCQMRCAFCLHGVGPAVPRQLLDYASFRRIVDEGERFGLVSMKLNYINEPLLRRDLPDFIRYAKDHGVLNVYFATNGLLLDRGVAEELIDAGLDKVMISLDAVTPEVFREIRRSDRLEEIVENIHSLLSLRRSLRVGHPLVRVNFLRTRINAHEADDFVAYWSGVADMIGFQSQVGLPGIDDDLLPPDRNGADPAHFRCAFPWKLLVVDADGAILPCCTFSGRSMPIGNVASMTLAEAWAKSRVLANLHRDGRGLSNPICAHCVGTS